MREGGILDRGEIHAKERGERKSRETAPASGPQGVRVGWGAGDGERWALEDIPQSGGDSGKDVYQEIKANTVNSRRGQRILGQYVVCFFLT